MQEFLKPLQEDPLFASEDSDGTGQGDQGSSAALMSFGAEALAEAISKHGGFGIAAKILDHFRTQEKSNHGVSSAKI
jgi:hypothetical protein